ncbi:MAG: cation-translocating P-type ATPase [Bacteroidia bacterium]|nr:cation-translocating P-type ATPase [Bacteroidia bacterium]
MASVEATYKVVGMTCQSCAASVQTLLQQVPGVEKVEVYFNTQEVLIVHEPEKAPYEVLKAAISPAGYELIQDAHTQLLAQERFLRKMRNKLWIMGATAAFGMIVHVAPHWSFFSFLGQIYFLLSLPLVIWVGRHFWRPAWQQLRVRQLTMDSLITVGLIGSIALGSLEMLQEQPGHAITAAAEILFFVLIGRYLEEKARYRTQSVLGTLSTLAAPTARRLVDNQVEIISTTEIKPGDVLQVEPQETFPIDGRIIEGTSFIEESLLTGESLPTEKGPSAQVWAGTRNLSSRLLIRAEVSAQGTFLAQLIARLQKAQSSQARAQRLADKVSAYFIPLVLTLAAATIFYHIGRGENMFFAWERALSVLVISCPCALGLATPLAVQMAIGGAARSQMLLREIAQLENLPLATTWAFDKTGTLTEGHAQVHALSWNAPEYAGKLLSLTQRSLHPLSQALASYLEKETAPEPLEVFAYVELPGRGIVATLPTEKIFIGNPTWIAEKHPNLSIPSTTAVAAATEKKLIGVFTFSDPPRKRLISFLKHLKREGKKLVLLTGDPSLSGKELGEKLGFDEIYINLSPFEKAQWIEERQKQGEKIVFVGDGLNDALALRAAYVGIAVHRSAGPATQSAGIALLHDTETALPALYELSLRLRRIIAQNLGWAFGYNLVALPLAMGLFPGLYVSPSLSALLMSMSSLTVVLNSLRIRVRSSGGKTLPEMPEQPL